MFNISDYLKKFARLEGDSRIEREAVTLALKEVCGIQDASFEAKKGILFIKGSGAMKAVIFTKKAAIIQSIKSKYPQSRIFDVK